MIADGIKTISARIDALPVIIRILLCVAILLPLYFYYVSGLTVNPPGFYLDEAAVSYNAYTIYDRGEGEFGHKFPLYFPVFPLGPPFNYLGYVEPTQIYALAALYYIFPPSVAVARGLSATTVFLACLLLGLFAYRETKSPTAASLFTLAALFTPWMFEIGRLAFGASLYPLMIALLVLAVYRASRNKVWNWTDCVLIALALAMATYTYAIGRLLGPLFALGLILFISLNGKQIVRILVTWVLYGLALIPMVVFYLKDPMALTGRITFSVGYITAEKSYWQIFNEFVGHYLSNVSPWFLIAHGDLNLRHHAAGTGIFFASILLLSIVGIFVGLFHYRKDAFWRYAFFGLLISPVAASFTKDDFHMLRLSALPVFLLVFAVPTIKLLVGNKDIYTENVRGPALRYAAIAITGLLIVATLFQAYKFDEAFDKAGPERTRYFDVNFMGVYAAALEQPERPIYLVDQYYYLAKWHSIAKGVDLSNFFQMPPRDRPMADSVILSGEEKCTDCEIYEVDIPFILYKTLKGPGKPGDPVPRSTRGSGPGQFVKPMGLAVAPNGNYYVADTENSRVEIFSVGNTFQKEFPVSPGDGGKSQPHGIAVAQNGDIYVTDPVGHIMLRYSADGNLLSKYRGPDSGFYGPRDLEFSSNGKLYIVDQGRNRIVIYDPESDSASTFGGVGSDDGLLNDPTGIDIVDDLIFVTDTGNGRVQVFDLAGKYIRQWPVPQWQKRSILFPDIAYDKDSKRVFVSSAISNELLEFTSEGRLVGRVELSSPNEVRNPTSLLVTNGPKGNRLLILNTGNDAVGDGDPGIAVFELGGKKK